MSDEQSSAERILSDGARARALITDPLMVNVLQALRQALVEQFFSTPAQDAAAREMLHHMSGAQRRFELAFTSLVQAADIELMHRNDDEMQRRASELIDQQIRSR